jgi:flagellin-like protein
LNKRGISPLIATVLIIGFTIVLAVLVIAWLSGVLQGQIGGRDCEIEAQNYCANVRNLITVTPVFNDPDDIPDNGDEEIDVTIAYLGEETTLKVTLTFKDANGNVLGVVPSQEITLTEGVGQHIWTDGNNSILESQAATLEMRILTTPQVADQACEEVPCGAMTFDVR